MSDEIYLNTGTTIQQPYQAQGPANAQEPVIAQQVRNYTANKRQPLIYQTRTPFTYRNPSSARQPNIRDTQSPFTYARQGQTPFTYQYRSPSTYARQGQTPFTYSHRQPVTYARQGQTPFTYDHQQPFTYRNPTNAQSNVERSKQSPFTYGHPAAGQSPFTYQHRSPFTYVRQGQSPFTYQATGTTPVIYSYQQPFPYIANGQQPTIKNAQQPYPFTSTQASSVPTLATGRQPYIYAAYTYHNTGSTGTTNPVHTIDVSSLDQNTANAYIWVKTVGSNLEIYVSASMDSYADFRSLSGGSGGISSQTNYKVATLVDGAGYKVRYTAGSYYDITYENGEPTVIPALFASNIPNSTSTTASVTIGTNTLWSAGSVHYLRSRITAIPDSAFDGIGSAGASIDVNLFFDKTGAATLSYPLSMWCETDFPEEEEENDCPQCCVHESMLIATGEDMKSIHDIKIGDSVVSYNFETGENELVEVEDLITIERDVDYKVNDLILTEDHPVYLETGKKASVSPSATLTNYKQEVDQIEVGDVMVKLDGTTEEITSIERYEGTHLNYAIKTKHNNFYADGVLVDSVIQRGKE